MKKSAQVTLTVVAAMGLACSRRPADPCGSSTFSENACQEAVRDGGYHWHGAWFPMVYRSPYPYYFDAYRSYVSGGGASRPAPANAYSRPASGSGGQHGVSVPRGGFGSTGAGHGVGA
jgi:hypothetical protein